MAVVLKWRTIYNSILFCFFLEAKLKQCFINIIWSYFKYCNFWQNNVNMWDFFNGKKAIRKMFSMILYYFTPPPFFYPLFYCVGRGRCLLCAFSAENKPVCLYELLARTGAVMLRLEVKQLFRRGFIYLLTSPFHRLGQRHDTQHQ